MVLLETLQKTQIYQASIGTGANISVRTFDK